MKRKGMICIGYKPKTGQPKDEKGNLILEYQYRRASPKLDRPCGAHCNNPKCDSVRCLGPIQAVASRRVSRGSIQGELL